jgi:acetyl esterase/lipase
MIIMSELTTAAPPDAATDPRIEPNIRSFLAEVNRDSSAYWERTAPEVQAVLTGLQSKDPVDMSGVSVSDKTVTENGRTVQLHVVKPQGVTDPRPVFLFVHGGVWKAGNFVNHQRLVRDLVVRTGATAVFPEYTSIPDAIYPTQIEEIYAAAKWVALHGAQIGVDGRRMAVVGNSVGGGMSTVLAMMAKDRSGPHICFQALLIPATDTNFETDSYRDFSDGRFLSRAFMQYGWNTYAPDAQSRKARYAVPLQASIEQLRGLPPALVITAENDPLRDEGEAYARRLAEAGVEVTAVRYNGMIHDFVLLNGIHGVPGVQAALNQVSAELKRHLNP